MSTVNGMCSKHGRLLFTSIRLASSRRTPASLTSCRSNSSKVSIDTDLIRAFTSPDGQPILAGRPYLAGSNGAGMPRYLAGPRDGFPSVVDVTQLTSTEKLSQELADVTKTILRQKLPVSGAVLLKGLPLTTAQGVASFNRYLGVETMPYEGGTGVREAVESDVMTASREPPCYTIEPHNEMSYLPKFPTHLFFFCEIPPEPGCGGETVLVGNRQFQREINPEVKEKFKKLGVRYSNHLPSLQDQDRKGLTNYLSWQEVLQVDNRESAERIMSEQGYSYRFHTDGSLTSWHNLPATRPHHTTGEELWFNQAHLNVSYFQAHPFWSSVDIPEDKFPSNAHYGDGSSIEPEVLEHLREVTWKHAIGVQLKQGELVVLDNMLVQHGRLGYVGERRLLVTLISAMDVSA